MSVSSFTARRRSGSSVRRYSSLTLFILSCSQLLGETRVSSADPVLLATHSPSPDRSPLLVEVRNCVEEHRVGRLHRLCGVESIVLQTRTGRAHGTRWSEYLNAETLLAREHGLRLESKRNSSDSHSCRNAGSRTRFRPRQDSPRPCLSKYCLSRTLCDRAPVYA